MVSRISSGERNRQVSLGSDVQRTSSDYARELQSAPRSQRTPDILRVVPPTRVLRGFGAIFAQGHLKSFGLANGHSADPLELARQNHHVDTDRMFYSSRKATKINAFISHVWSAPRWTKALALLFYRNTTTAAISAIVVWLISTSLCIIFIGNGDFTSLGGKDLVPQLVWAPMATFFIVFFFGHMLDFDWSGEGWWLDKLCIHQSRKDLQDSALAALPEFVAKSDRIVILWSDSYFERLWCNAEVATFTAVNKGADKIDFVPLWLAPWILSTLLCDIFSITLWNRLSVWIMDVGVFLAENNYPLCLEKFLTPFLGIGAAMGTAYLPMVIPNLLSLRNKIEDHKLMLSHIERFRLQDAKCSDENDRAFIEEHVGQLFLDPSAVAVGGREWQFLEPEQQAASIGRFNTFVQTSFKRSICTRVGEVSRVPYWLALLAFMPLSFASVANVLGCDGADCKQSAPVEGYHDNITQFMLTNGFTWAVGIFLVYPTTYAVMLKGLHRCMDVTHNRVLQVILCAVTIAASYYYMGFVEGLAAAIFVNTVTDGAFYWWITSATFLALLCWWNYYLFTPDFQHVLNSIATSTSSAEGMHETLLGAMLSDKDVREKSYFDDDTKGTCMCAPVDETTFEI
mmetsp:Transcript_26865/g.77745  ORF Transcript_26865/g.77745 Transcript_26865/m.77745 type:complete len:627 (-) Transcript_26865:233-2113(-)